MTGNKGEPKNCKSDKQRRQTFIESQQDKVSISQPARQKHHNVILCSVPSHAFKA